MKLLCIVGARPQFIKHAPLLAEAAKFPGINIITVHTGQHYDEKMSDIFFDELKMDKPNYNLNIGSASHGKQTGLMMIKLEEVCLEEKPDIVLVYGDTNSTLAGALVAAKLHIQLVHVESGLRSFNKLMPEEINRVMTDHISDVLFIPTEIAKKNLINEGISVEKIFYSGDVMYDAFKLFSEIETDYVIESDPYALVTIHRAENTDNVNNMNAITEALISFSEELELLIPLHPRTRKALINYDLISVWQSRFHLIEPLGYLEMIHKEKNARLIITDSGGVQKEAFFAKTPCVTLRQNTEWIELIDHGINYLANPNSSNSITQVIQKALTNEHNFNLDLYGNGTACNNILNYLTSNYYNE